jgi:hypothetical protein
MRFADKLKEMMSDGLNNFGPQVGAELGRLGRHGALEFASNLYTGNSFVPYGPGSYSPATENAEPGKGTPAVEVEHEREHGREM